MLGPFARLPGHAGVGFTYLDRKQAFIGRRLLSRNHAREISFAIDRESLWWWPSTAWRFATVFVESASVTVLAKEHLGGDSPQPRLAPYERLAPLWHLHSRRGSPRYERFSPRCAVDSAFRCRLFLTSPATRGLVLSRRAGARLPAGRGNRLSGRLLAESLKNCGRHRTTNRGGRFPLGCSRGNFDMGRLRV